MLHNEEKKNHLDAYKRIFKVVVIMKVESIFVISNIVQTHPRSDDVCFHSEHESG